MYLKLLSIKKSVEEEYQLELSDGYNICLFNNK